MYVIEGTLSQAERRVLFDDNTLTGDATVIFPADRCVWEMETYNDSNYELGRAAVIGGGREFLISNARLGVLGKSGRFVGMTV